MDPPPAGEPSGVLPTPPHFSLRGWVRGGVPTNPPGRGGPHHLPLRVPGVVGRGQRPAVLRRAGAEPDGPPVCDVGPGQVGAWVLPVVYFGGRKTQRVTVDTLLIHRFYLWGLVGF